MKVKLEIELQPFSVPNYVLVVTKPGKREEGIKDTPKYRLCELSDDILNRLCDEFKKGVFERAKAQADNHSDALEWAKSI